MVGESREQGEMRRGSVTGFQARSVLMYYCKLEQTLLKVCTKAFPEKLDKWLFTGEWINKALCIHRTEYSSVIKRNHVTVRATIYL